MADFIEVMRLTGIYCINSPAICEKCRKQPILTDIAKKLGIEPIKEGKENNHD